MRLRRDPTAIPQANIAANCANLCDSLRLNRECHAFAEVVEQRLDGEVATAGPLEDLRGGEAAAMAVDPIPQPSPQRVEIAVPNLGRATAEVPPRGRPQRAPDGVAEAQGRE